MTVCPCHLSRLVSATYRWMAAPAESHPTQCSIPRAVALPRQLQHNNILYA